MSNWKKVRLGEVINILGGGTPKTTNDSYWGGHIPWLSVKDFNKGNKYVYTTEKSITDEGLNNSSTQLLKKGDIIISARGTVGELAVIPYSMAFNQSCYGLRGKKDVIEQGFLYYLLKFSILTIKSNTHGSVFDTITRETFNNIEANLPPLEEQQRIARILGALDDKIECNNRINRNLEEQAAALFRRWFVDFEFPDSDPTSPTYGKPYRSSGGEIQDSHLGSIPQGWQVGTLLEIANYLNGLAMQKFRPQDGEQGIPVLKIKELGQGKCDSSSDLCSESIKEEYIINDGDVVFSWSGTLMTDIWCGGKCGLNQHLFKVTSSLYPKWFYFQWTKYHLDKFIRIAKDKAVTMGHIKREDLQKSSVLIPDGVTLVRMNELMSPLLAERIALSIENRTLTELRDTLLPKLMNNQI